MNRSFAFLASLGLAVAGGCSQGPTHIRDEYRSTADRIITATMAGNDSWRKMEELCDGIGHRLSGSPALRDAIRWAIEAMEEDGQENVRGEEVRVPRWVRGEESLRMVSPKEGPLAMLGLGGSVGTSDEGITASVVCVCDEREFEAAGDKLRGRIVLFNNPMKPYDQHRGSGYGTAVRFRGKGPSMAAERGAVACLVRSVTARSLRSPHTGALHYEDAAPKIPAAAISTEDADHIARLLARGLDVTVTLKMQARTEGEAPSANVVGELRGRERPEEIVVISGHLDSWDVGQGAHDDAAGCVMAMEAINVLRKLQLVPRRTIRVVLWTNEENGLGGAKDYVRRHAGELARHVAAIEADSGAFRPEGLTIECAEAERQKRAAAQLRAIAALLERLGPQKVTEGHSGADVGQMKSAGVVCMGLDVEGSRYFDYHHTNADTLDKVDPKELSQCVAAMAVSAYVIADLPYRLGDEPIR